jgi:hypothetical protein
LLKDHRRPTDPFHLEGDSYLDAVGDLDEGNVAVHPVVFTVERHCALNLAGGFTFALGGEDQRIGFGDSADRKVALHVKRVGCRLHNLRGLEGDQRILLYVEEVFALQLVVLKATSGIHGGASVNFRPMTLPWTANAKHC